MDLSQITANGYILALFIRDDEERFLLGTGFYQFKQKQLHFAANTISNDVMEVQGNDGYLLAGQVRRPGVQSFDGYVGDGTTSKADVENYRRDFFRFFRKNYFYKVVYIFPNGKAIQRKRGFIVDDATVKELYQMYPEYHVALNFEDVNYYTYSEDGSGQEIYAEEADIPLTLGRPDGGLVWDAYGAVSNQYTWGGIQTVTGSNLTITNSLSMPAPYSSVELLGLAGQQTYSGANLFNMAAASADKILAWTTGNEVSNTGSVTSDYIGVVGGDTINANYIFAIFFYDSAKALIGHFNGNQEVVNTTGGGYFDTVAIPDGYNIAYCRLVFRASQGDNPSTLTDKDIMVNKGVSLLPYQPYVGGEPSPSPSYPQTIDIATGTQNVWVHGKNLADPQTFINWINTTYDLCLQYSWGNEDTRPKYGVYQGRNHVARFSGSTLYSVRDSMTNPTYDESRIIYQNLGFKENTQYTVSFDVNSTGSGTTTNLQFLYTDGSTSGISGASQNTWTHVEAKSQSSKTISAIRIIYLTGIVYIDLDTLQIEEGSATTYEPYQGATYTIDLGSIELAKILSARDEIIYTNGNWVKYEGIGKTTDGVGSTGITIPNMAQNSPVLSYCGGTVSGRTITYAEALTVANTIYYIKRNVTGTAITDAGLIAQLNAFRNSKLAVGTNFISITPASGLNPELQLSYYTTVTTDGAGYEWEDGTSGGATVVDIETIENVYPVWELQGPATNPTLSILSTNTTITYNGTVSASQTLVVDMFNKTATVNGSSMIGNISGDWVYLQSGNNRISYTASNSNAPDSKIYWQEIVG